MKALLKTALLGTAKHPPALAECGEDLAALLSPGKVEAEDQLLLAAGAASLYEQAGQQPVPGIAPLVPAQAATGALRSSQLVMLLQQALAAENPELLREFLHLLTQQQRHLPYEVLPLALDVTDATLRQQLVPVLGERGRWLSQFQPSWNWVELGIHSLLAVDQTALLRAWSEGKLAQRLVALAVQRRSNPAEGRRWLEETLPQEKADARAQLVDQLSTGLSLEDEPLLEKLLDDRSEQVKQVAAMLLRQLPGSALAVRMRVRAEQMLVMKQNRLQALPPEELTADWMRDGISAKAVAGKGKRAMWVEALLSAVPVNHWTTHFHLEPLPLLHAVQSDDYAHDVVLGWTRSLQLYSDHTAATLNWAFALWNYWLAYWQQDKKKNLETLGRLVVLLKLLPPTTAEQQLLPFLVKGRLHTDALLMLLDVLPRPWSLGFATQYLKLARQMTQTGVVDEAYEWSKSLDVASRAIPKAAFPAALVPWDRERLKSQSWTARALEQLIDRFTSVVQVRQLFQEELAKAVQK